MRKDSGSTVDVGGLTSVPEVQVCSQVDLQQEVHVCRQVDLRRDVHMRLSALIIAFSNPFTAFNRHMDLPSILTPANMGLLTEVNSSIDWRTLRRE